MMHPDKSLFRSIAKIRAQIDALAEMIAPAESEAPNPPGRPPTRHTHVPLPDPRLLRHIIHQRQLRAKYFARSYFSDPAWDMLLDLAAAQAERKRVSVKSLCIASGVPPTTALRWISALVDDGLLARTNDDTDRRRAFITLTDRAADSIARYFAAIGQRAYDLI